MRPLPGIVAAIVIIAIIAGIWVWDMNRESAKTDKYPLHENITATVFWIGEPGSEENGYIPNNSSAWDDLWLQHYGGVDDPSNRNGYFPANFTPKENPFYIALPYNDFYEICWR